MPLTLFGLSLLGGVLSGMLGVGGAVVMIPLMLVVPAWVGVGSLDMRTVAGISMLQVFASALSGLIVHRNRGAVNGVALRWIGVPMAVAAFAGAATTRYMNNTVVLVVFTVLVGVSFLLLALSKPVAEHRRGAQPIPNADVPVRRWQSCLVGSGVGLASGMVGAGGGFILVPLMIVVLGIPLRITVGTSLGIVFLGALTGTVGKVVSGQVAWEHLLPVILGSVPAARLGARWSHQLPSAWLRRMLLALVLFSFLNSLWKLFQG